DLWALGVVAYHCLTGAVPFSGETLASLCVAIANGSFDPPTQRRPELLPAVDAWFARALAKVPDERFESAKEMAQTFAAALGGSLDDLGTGSFRGVDWTGPHGIVRVSQPTFPEPSDPFGAHLSVAPPGAQPAASSQAPRAGSVPTFAGTTLDRGAPKRRAAFAAV